MRPEQRHHVVGELRQLVVELLADAAGEEGNAFEDAFDVGVGARVAECAGDFRVDAGELRANFAQFSLLVLVNAFVGAMIGMERAILSPIAEQSFHLAARTAWRSAGSRCP